MTLNNSRLIRPLVHKLHAYVPGEEPKIKGLIKLNTNENPYPSPPQARSSAFMRFPAPEPPEGGTPNVLLEPFHRLA